MPAISAPIVPCATFPTMCAASLGGAGVAASLLPTSALTPTRMAMKLLPETASESSNPKISKT